MKNLHAIERPREKLIKYGASKLTDKELLAVILNTGRKGKHVLELAKEIIQKKIISPEVLSSVFQTKQKLSVGLVQACRICASYEFVKRLITHKQESVITPYRVWEILTDIRNERKEHFVILYLNAQNILIHQETISIGTLNASLVHPREVYEPAVRLTAGQIIVCHNHPSGNPYPSQADIDITLRLKKAGEIMGISLIDHVIVGKESYFSFAEKKLM